MRTMTTEPIPLVTTRTDEEQQDAEDSFPFTLGRDSDGTAGHPPPDSRVFTARKPKMATMLRLGRAVEGVELETATLGSMVGVLDDLIDAILNEDDREYVRSKMDDPDSDWDIDMVVPLLEVVRSKWWPERPTKRSGGSSGPQRKRGKRSTVR